MTTDNLHNPFMTPPRLPGANQAPVAPQNHVHNDVQPIPSLMLPPTISLLPVLASPGSPTSVEAPDVNVHAMTTIGDGLNVFNELDLAAISSVSLFNNGGNQIVPLNGNDATADASEWDDHELDNLPTL